MVRVSLVVVSVGLGVHLWGELFHDALDDVLDRVLLRGVAVPDSNQVGVEADRKANTTELILYRQQLLVLACLGLGGREVHTFVKNTLQLLADSKELDTSPNVGAQALRETECPATT